MSATASVGHPTRDAHSTTTRAHRGIRALTPRLIALAVIVLLAMGGAIAVFSVSSSSQADQLAPAVPAETLEPAPEPEAVDPAPQREEPTPAPTQTPELVIPTQP